MPIKVTMPALSPTMTEGTLAKWLKKEGDTVAAGDVIAEIETDKATMEVEAVDEGRIGKILVKEGTENVPVNAVIAVLLEEGEKADTIDAFLSGGSPEKAAPKAQADANKVQAAPPVPAASPASAPNNAGRVAASPLARRIAAQKGINLSSVRGSGPKGRIIKSDLDKAPASGGPASASRSVPASSIDARKTADLLGMGYTLIPNNNIKKVTAARLQESKSTVPHFYLTVECTLDKLLDARQQINEAGNGVKLSVNDFVIKAAALALKAFPAANVSWTEEGVLQYSQIDISVAVSTPNGLMTPIVKAADGKGLSQISSEIKDLAGRAREGKLKPQEFQGGTFTVSNLGMYGITAFGAIINPPQSCILAVGAGIQRPVVENGQIVIRTVMNCTLSVDHRSVDGAVGAEYLQHFKRFIENPVSMLL